MHGCNTSTSLRGVYLALNGVGPVHRLRSEGRLAVFLETCTLEAWFLLVTRPFALTTTTTRATAPLWGACVRRFTALADVQVALIRGLAVAASLSVGTVQRVGHRPSI